MSARRGTGIVAALLVCGARSATLPALEIAPGSDFRGAMQNLHPGDTLILDGGTYSFSGYFELDIAGTAAQPIVIRAHTGQQPLIQYMNGPTITQGDGIEIKKGSYANSVRDNVIHDTGYPGITLYDVNGNGAPNVIERNIVWHSGDNGIQVTADAIVRNNIVLGAAGSAFASNAVQNGSAANLVIVNNTFLMPTGNGIKLNSVSGSVTIANNAIYAPNGRAIDANGTLGGIVSIANAGLGALNGVSAGFNGSGNIAADFVGASLSGAPPQNLIPQSATVLDAANAAYLPAEDFDLQARNGHVDIGAYRTHSNSQPLWTITADFKNIDEIFANSFE